MARLGIEIPLDDLWRMSSPLQVAMQRLTPMELALIKATGQLARLKNTFGAPKVSARRIARGIETPLTQWHT